MKARERADLRWGLGRSRAPAGVPRRVTIEPPAAAGPEPGRFARHFMGLFGSATLARFFPKRFGGPQR